MEIDTEHKHLSFQGRESNMVFETTLPSTSVFSSPQEIALYEELLDLLPDAIKSLSIVDPKHSDRIKSMMKLMADGKCPYDNIAFLMFEDVIKWFVSGDVRSMRYSEEVRRFWLTGAQLFGNNYIEFCRGPGFKGIGVNDKHEPLTPAMSSINFAVPSRGNLQPRDTDRIIPQNLNPGTLKEMIDVYINEHPNATTVSHKKINTTLTNARLINVYVEIKGNSFSWTPIIFDSINTVYTQEFEFEFFFLPNHYVPPDHALAKVIRDVAFPSL